MAGWNDPPYNGGYFSPHGQPQPRPRYLPSQYSQLQYDPRYGYQLPQLPQNAYEQVGRRSPSHASQEKRSRSIHVDYVGKM